MYLNSKQLSLINNKSRSFAVGLCERRLITNSGTSCPLICHLFIDLLPDDAQLSLKLAIHKKLKGSVINSAQIIVLDFISRGSKTQGGSSNDNTNNVGVQLRERCHFLRNFLFCMPATIADCFRMIDARSTLQRIRFHILT